MMALSHWDIRLRILEMVDSVEGDRESSRSLRKQIAEFRDGFCGFGLGMIELFAFFNRMTGITGSLGILIEIH